MTIKGSVMSLMLLTAVVAPIAMSATEAEAHSRCRRGCYFVKVCVAPGRWVSRVVTVPEIRYDACGRPYTVWVHRVVRTWVPPRYAWRCRYCRRMRPYMPERSV